MSSQISANANDLFVRPPEIDEGAYLRIRQMRSVERAASQIIDHNIELSELAVDSKGWYRGETLVVPMEYMSLKLNPDMNNATDLLAGFVDTVKGFSPGSFPGHCHAVRELEFTTKHLINTLATLVDAAAFAHSLKCLGAFFAAVSDPANTTLQRHDHVQRIDTKLEQLVDSFRGIAREFAMREREIVFSAIPRDTDAKADELLAVAKETNAVVKRIDARDVKRGKRQREIDKQERCYALWTAGQCKEGVIALAGKKRVSRNDVFEYYKRELKAIGVKSAAEFARSLHARTQRLSRQTSN